MRRLVLIAIVAAGSACGNGEPASPSPIGAASASLTLTISGPTAMVPGSSAQFRAVRSMPDGTGVDVTSAASWISSRPDVVEISASGLAIAKSAGESTVQASFQGKSVTASILAMEDGRFKLEGTVFEYAARSFGFNDAIQGATVEVLTGIGAGLRTTANAKGEYALYGVAGTIEVRITADNYKTDNVELNITKPTVRSFPLVPAAGIPNMAGQWTLTFSVGPSCTTLSADDRRRMFNVDITHLQTPETPVFNLRLASPTLEASNRIPGLIIRGEILITIWHNPGAVFDPEFGPINTEYAILERLNPGHLGIWGTLRATFDGTRAAATLDGGFDYFPAAVGPGLATMGCAPVSAILERR